MLGDCTLNIILQYLFVNVTFLRFDRSFEHEASDRQTLWPIGPTRRAEHVSEVGFE